MNRTQSAIRTMWGWAAKRHYFTCIACQTTYAIGCIEQPTGDGAANESTGASDKNLHAVIL